MYRFIKIMIASGLLFAAVAQPALADVVVIVSANSPVTTLSATQIARIFQGKSNMMTPVDIEGHSASRREFYSKVVGMDDARVREIWSKLVFTGKGWAPRERASGTDVVKLIAADPNAIGYVDKSFVNMTVKIIYTVK
jgi:ABC-type phosphate transport system substrate-binding protein